MYIIKLINVKILLTFLCLILFNLPVWTQTADTELPAVKVAISDDQSIVMERILFEGLKRSGYQMVAKATGMRTAVADVNYGDADILPVQTDGWDILYPNLIKVPVAIDNVEFTAYSLNSASYQFSGWEDMAGLRLGYRWQNEFIANNIRRANARELVRLNDIDELWASLLSGETDVILLPRMSHYEHRFPQGIKRVSVFEKQPVYSYVHNRHDNLVPLLEKAYNDMFADGTMSRIQSSQKLSADKPVILYINSYSAQNDREHSHMESIRRFLEQDIESAFEIYNYYLNSDEFNRQARFDAIVSDMIRTSFVDHYPDLIIASGNDAFTFVMNNYYLLFPNVPVLFFGVHGLEASMLYGLEDRVTGIAEEISFLETAAHMLRLFPETKRIFILNDYSNSASIKLHEDIQKAIEGGMPGADVEFVFNVNKPLAEIIDDIKRFGSDTLVLIGNYISDSDGSFYSESDVQTLISQASLNPVFCLTASYIGIGTLGGLLSSTDARDKEAALMASDLLRGKLPSLVPVLYNSKSLNQWQFDYETAKKFKINTRVLPANHVIINRTLPIWESNPLEFRLMIAVVLAIILIVFVIVYIRDSRRHKVYAKRLRQARDAAQTANRTKSSFLANMSHEIRTPMNSIIGFAELAQSSDTIKKIKEYLFNITESAQWLLKIINDILDISKIESGKIDLENIPFDLHDVLEHCRNTVMPKAEEKGILLFCYSEPSVNKRLLGDPVKLRQVIINLLSNAVKFTNAGSVKLMASLAHRSGNSVTICFEIKDSGIGMSPEQIERIFEPFMQADSSVTRRFGGTGLGLPISKNIIELMGGELHVESALNIGSKFSFEITFDLTDDNSETLFQDKLPYLHRRPEFSGEVLICEDNSLNRQLICDHLSRVGLKTVVAHNGREGLDCVEERMQNGKKPFDLIFMDIHMPEMDGLEASSKIIKMGVKTPIVALTANIMSAEKEIYKKSGMIDFLGKPFASQELWERLIKYIPVTGYTVIENGKQREEDKKTLINAQIDFARNNKTVYQDLIKAIESGDFKKAHRMVHTLKSNAGQIGAKKLQAAVMTAEELLAAVLTGGKSDSSLPGKDEIIVLETELKTVMDELSPLLSEIEAKRAVKTSDAQKIREILSRLEPMLKNKNPECEDLLDDIHSIPGCDKLARHIENFNFKQAAEELAEIMKEWG
jgi:signal transduction histidine kinase/CheY-like chemotaxis protein